MSNIISSDPAVFGIFQGEFGTNVKIRCLTLRPIFTFNKISLKIVGLRARGLRARGCRFAAAGQTTSGLWPKIRKSAFQDEFLGKNKNVGPLTTLKICCTEFTPSEKISLNFEIWTRVLKHPVHNPGR